MGKIDFSQKSLAECSAMLLFSHIFIMSVQPGTLITKKIMQNKYIHFCLKLDKMHYISEKQFRLINWFPPGETIDQCINTTTYNYANNTCPYYLNDIFEFAPHCRRDTRHNVTKLKNPFHKTNMGEKSHISYIGLCIWNSLPD